MKLTWVSRLGLRQGLRLWVSFRHCSLKFKRSTDGRIVGGIEEDDSVLVDRTVLGDVVTLRNLKLGKAPVE
jgi:hypothetical protein